MAETKKMVFDEMDGKGITISVGIALAPEHGKTYMNLYRSADQALYGTKWIYNLWRKPRYHGK